MRAADAAFLDARWDAVARDIAAELKRAVPPPRTPARRGAQQGAPPSSAAGGGSLNGDEDHQPQSQSEAQEAQSRAALDREVAEFVPALMRLVRSLLRVARQKIERRSMQSSQQTSFGLK